MKLYKGLRMLYKLPLFKWNRSLDITVLRNKAKSIQGYVRYTRYKGYTGYKVCKGCKGCKGYKGYTGCTRYKRYKRYTNYYWDYKR